MTRNATARLALLILIACLVATAIVLLLRTETGRLLLSPHHLRHDVGERARQWVDRHPVVAPLIFVATYVTCSLLMLPVWWLQLLAGYAFGVVMGTLWNCAGATAGAAATISLSHWLGGDWVHARAGRRLHRLQELSIALEHNGFLVVLLTRLLHGIPFGLSNYVFGLMGIHPRDAAAGTFVGAVPVNAFYAALGADPKLVKSWRFWLIVVAINLLLLTPMGINWLRQKRAARAAR